MLNSRIYKTLSKIEEPGFLGPTEGHHYVKQIKDALSRFDSYQVLGFDSALSLGERADTSTQRFPSLPSFSRSHGPGDQETERRHAIRACLLAEFAIKKRSSKFSTSLIQRFQHRSKNELIQLFKMSFPLVTDRGNRNAWRAGFTDPLHHNDARFRYIVHALRLNEVPDPNNTSPWTSANSILADPNAKLRNWFAISCSLIDQAHRQTFKGCGLILRVPVENILTTHTGDLGFPNQVGAVLPPWANTPATKRQATGALLEKIRDYDVAHGGLHTPSQVLAGTGRRNTAYNEIVVTGSTRGPNGGSVVTVSGLFLQQKEAGTEKAMRLAATHLHVPLVIIR